VTGGDAVALVGALVTLRPLTEETERLRAQVARHTVLADDGFLTLAVEHEQAMVGDVQARAPRHAFPPGVCEIGVTLFSEVRGQGLGTDAVRLLTRYLHATGWSRVQASTAVTNQGMQRVLQRSGYALEGTLRSFAPQEDGRREDYLMYASVQQPGS
jgi:RimJ/RimL family protein N-acetyltransferase